MVPTSAGPSAGGGAVDGADGLCFPPPMTIDGLDLATVDPADAGEILVLQRAAYVTEAQIYGEPYLPPLVQTLEDLRHELATTLALKAVVGHRIVGAIRGRVDGPTCHVGRLTVAPDLQNRGIGSALLRRFEADVAARVDRFELFTGSLSLANIRLYERFGYRELRREKMSSSIELLFMDKPSPGEATPVPDSGPAART